MHYSCQSLLIEAGALDANKTVSALMLPVAETVGSGGRTLSAITWTLAPLTSALVSLIPALSSARGYALVETTHTTTFTRLSSVDNGVTILPNAAAVVLTFALPLSNFYARTDLVEKQTITALLTSIVGLAGVFGFFGTVLNIFDSVTGVSHTAAKQVRRRLKLTASTRIEAIDHETETIITNPMRSRNNHRAVVKSILSLDADYTSDPLVSQDVITPLMPLDPTHQDVIITMTPLSSDQAASEAPAKKEDTRLPFQLPVTPDGVVSSTSIYTGSSGARAASVPSPDWRAASEPSPDLRGSRRAQRFPLISDDATNFLYVSGLEAARSMQRKLRNAGTLALELASKQASASRGNGSPKNGMEKIA